ncbi:calcium-binding protein [Thermococcus siculi]|uniref:Calcium-binding protein n=1 Tax=Thermococcus siculi TaxID=72803 RepID=A0A2Z2MK48_9EURY|nr:transglutaminase-like domain-containing protein [Thermococcus siculi]ASJ07791.1 calcium-binding protein [Thermococcus siculi]
MSNERHPQKSKVVRYLVGVAIIMLVFAVGATIKNDDHDSLSIVDELTKYHTDPFNPDTDGDGLTDGDEVKLYTTSPTVIDSDSDGLTDGDEILKYKTNPSSPDTDGDGISDSEEIKTYRTNPNLRDSDGDGLLDGQEITTYMTDPLNPDTDKDGVPDSQEVEKGTDPHKTDTDNDGLTDREEILEFGTDPLSKDTDEDGLSDLEEVKTYKTSPLTSDTDGDGLSDPEELSFGTDPLNEDSDYDGLTDGEELSTYRTNPLISDSDNDGLDDGQEAISYRTNPLDPDTDDDYLSDGYEVQLGTDPLYDWRDTYNKEAFKAGLSQYFREKLRPVTQDFVKYHTTLDKAWAILEWIDENIEYYHTKADYVDALLYNWSELTPEQRELYNNLTRLYAPNDTIVYRKGICGDYAILTAAMLLDSGVSPVYLLDISFENSKVGHAAVAVKIEGDLFVLDQHLPPIPIGNYYWKWAIENNSKIIANMTFYEVRLNTRGEPEVTDTWTWSGEELRKKTYIPNEEDTRLIKETVKEKFLRMYPQYVEDSRLKSIVEQHTESLKYTGEPSNAYLPHGFSKGWVLWLSNEYIWLYYSPITIQKLVDYWIMPAFSSEGWAEVIRQCDRFYLLMDYVPITVSDGVTTITVPKILLVMEVAS